MLLDSGSHLSFLDYDMAKSAMIPLLTKTKPMMITVANGEKMYSDAKCQGVKWEMQRA